MVQDPFALLSYLLEHANENSLVPLRTSNNVVILMKESKYSFTIYILEEGEIAKIRREFLPTTLHKVVYEVIDELKERLSTDLSDLQIARDLDTPKIMELLRPRRSEREEERSRGGQERKRQRETRKSQPAVEKLRLKDGIHVFPLLKLGSSFFSMILETASVSLFDLPESRPFWIKNEAIEKYDIHEMRTIYLLLAQAKMDTLRERNPITEAEVNGGHLTFFSAFFLNDEAEENTQREFTFMGRKARGLQREYKFFRLGRTGSVRVYPRKVFSVTQDLEVGVGFFFHDGQTIVRTGGIDLVKSHERGEITFNEYVLSSIISVYNSLSTYSKVMTGIMNMGVSKRIPSHLVRDIMEIDSNPMSISPLVENVVQDEIRYYDPVENWYSLEVLGKQEPSHCSEVSSFVNLRRSVMNDLVRLGWFKDFLV